MKITIGGSMTFAKEQLEASKFLEERGYEVFLTEDISHFIEQPEIKDDAEKSLELSIKYDVIREFFDKIAKSDVYLVCNYEKNGIPGYLGASVLMEIGLAYYLN
ncbi:MAG: Maf-like protein, partial [Candidatus Falkowbacteria bacterium GW2011_GWF2_39_8]